MPKGLLPVKFALSINLASVLILVTVAPVKSFPAVISFTVTRIADIVPRALLTVNLGLGS